MKVSQNYLVLELQGFVKKMVMVNWYQYTVPCAFQHIGQDYHAVRVCYAVEKFPVKVNPGKKLRYCKQLNAF